MHDKHLSDKITLNLKQLTTKSSLLFFQCFKELRNMLQTRFQVPKQITGQRKCLMIDFSKTTCINNNKKILLALKQIEGV